VAEVHRPPGRELWYVVAAVVAVAIVVLAGVWLSRASAPPSPPGTPQYATYPFPPVWTTSLPNDTAFGGVLDDGAYLTVVPMSPLPAQSSFQFQVVAFALDNGAVLWRSAPLTILNKGDVQPALSVGPSEVYLVGYAQSVVSPGQPWNGSAGVFEIGFDATNGAVLSVANQFLPSGMQTGELAVSAGAVYYGYLANGGAQLGAFPLPADAASSASWSETFLLPADFSSNLVLSIDGGFEMILLPSSIAVLDAVNGTFLEEIPFAAPLNLFDGTVLGGVAYGVDWATDSLDLVGYDLSSGTQVVNHTLGDVAIPAEPFEVRHIGDELFVSTSEGAQWSAYTPTGSLLWSSPTLPTNFGPSPIPIAPNEVLLYGSNPSSATGTVVGNASFPAEFILENLTTGATLWEQSSWFEIPEDTSLFLTPDAWETPPGPFIEAAASSDVVFWWAGTTGLATL